MKTFLKKFFHRLHMYDEEDNIKRHTKTHQHKYPLNMLAQHVGEPIEVQYVDLGLPQIMQGKLNSSPSDSAFYVSLDETHMNIVYWYNTHADGRVSGVKLIKYAGDVVYRNNELPFDYDIAERYEQGQHISGPIRMMTREYLKGVFG